MTRHPQNHIDCMLDMERMIHTALHHCTRHLCTDITPAAHRLSLDPLIAPLPLPPD